MFGRKKGIHKTELVYHLYSQFAANYKAFKLVCGSQKLNEYLKMQKAKSTPLLNSFETYQCNRGYLGYTR